MRPLIKILLLSLVLSLITGCTVIWSDDVFVGTLFKNFDASQLEMISEPNYLQIGSDTLKTKNTPIQVITPAVVVGTGE